MKLMFISSYQWEAILPYKPPRPIGGGLVVELPLGHSSETWESTEIADESPDLASNGFSDLVARDAFILRYLVVYKIHPPIMGSKVS